MSPFAKIESMNCDRILDAASGDFVFSLIRFNTASSHAAYDCVCPFFETKNVSFLKRKMKRRTYAEYVDYYLRIYPTHSYASGALTSLFAKSLIRAIALQSSRHLLAIYPLPNNLTLYAILRNIQCTCHKSQNLRISCF
jgi:hypothetical protein